MSDDKRSLPKFKIFLPLLEVSSETKGYAFKMHFDEILDSNVKKEDEFL